MPFQWGRNVERTSRISYVIIYDIGKSCSSFPPNKTVLVLISRPSAWKYCHNLKRNCVRNLSAFPWCTLCVYMVVSVRVYRVSSLCGRIATEEMETSSAIKDFRTSIWCQETPPVAELFRCVLWQCDMCQIPSRDVADMLCLSSNKSHGIEVYSLWKQWTDMSVSLVIVIAPDGNFPKDLTLATLDLFW